MHLEISTEMWLAQRGGGINLLRDRENKEERKRRAKKFSNIAVYDLTERDVVNKIELDKARKQLGKMSLYLDKVFLLGI